MNIRSAKVSDVDNLTTIESLCFPPSETATRDDFKSLLSIYPDYFWILEDEDKIASFIYGLITNDLTVNDEMFMDAHLHNPNGDYLAILGVSTLPEYRKKGLAGKLMKQVIQDIKNKNKKGCVLTCKEKLIPYYEGFGFISTGLSKSVFGGAIWYDMRLEF